MALTVVSFEHDHKRDYRTEHIPLAIYCTNCQQGAAFWDRQRDFFDGLLSRFLERECVCEDAYSPSSEWADEWIDRKF